MSLTVPVVSVVLDAGGTPAPLPFLDGSLTLDESNAPHVTGSLAIAIPGAWSLDAYGQPEFTIDSGTLADLDPLANVRIVTTVDDGSVVREFDLGLRDTDEDYETGVITLSVASDEALTSDYAPLADDETPYTYQASLRSVVNYVLGKAIPGAALAASPATDAAATVYANTTNECSNPSAGTDTSGWATLGITSLSRQTGVGAIFQNSTGTAFRLFGNASTGVAYIARTLTPTQVAGKQWAFRARQRNGSTIASGVADGGSRLVVVWNSLSLGAGSAQSTVGSQANNTTTDHYLRVTFPADIITASVRLYHGIKSADSVYWSDVRYGEFTGDPTDTGYFDGATADTAAYLYDWTGTAQLSTTQRVALIDRPVDALLWPAGTSALDYLRPLVQVNGLRLVCDEARVWTLRNEDYSDPGSVNIRYGVNMADGGEKVSRTDDTWMDAATTEYEWVDANGITRRRVDAYALTIPHTKLREFKRDTPYPGPGFSEYAVRRAQGKGREIQTTATADWTVRAEQPVVIYPPSPRAPQAGQTSRVEFDLGTNTMNIRTRTTELPVGAIDLKAGTVNALTGTVNAL